MKQRKISKTNVVNFSTYLGMVIFFLVMTALSKAGVLNRSMTGLLVPICCYMSMAVSLNLTVGILGELSLGHAGFMSVGAFAGVIASQSLLDVVPSAGLRLTIAMIVGALFATIAGFIVGAPVLRLQGDYLAIVTLAFGEIIKELVTCLITFSSTSPATKPWRIWASATLASPSSRVRRVPPASRLSPASPPVSFW